MTRLRKGEPWGRPAGGPPDLEVHGDDADLAAAAAAHPGARVRFAPTPGSDLARAVGLAGSPGGSQELPLDALALDDEGEPAPRFASNMIVLGVPPDRLGARDRRTRCRVEVDGRTVFDAPATTVVVANGQFLRGSDVVPRGHPGDGRCEVQVYAVAPAQRRAMRARLGTGSHVPHPEIRQFTGRAVSARFAAPRPVEIDGRAGPRRSGISVRVVPGALLLLV